MSTTEQYQQRMKRIDEALAVKEPDRVPVIPFVQTYSVTHSGHTMAEAMYRCPSAECWYAGYHGRSVRTAGEYP